MENSWINDDYYHLLGVTQLSSNDDINKAYRQKAKQFHPDKYPIDSYEYKKAEQEFKRLTLAKETLLDPEKRATYDTERLTIQECYLSYMANSFKMPIEKKVEPPPKKSFKDILNEKVEEQDETSTNYVFSPENNSYVSQADLKYQAQLSKEELAHEYKKEGAKKFYDLALKALAYKDYIRAQTYFKSAQYLDPTIRIPPAMYYMNKKNRY